VFYRSVIAETDHEVAVGKALEKMIDAVEGGLTGVVAEVEVKKEESVIIAEVKVQVTDETGVRILTRREVDTEIEIASAIASLIIMTEITIEIATGNTMNTGRVIVIQNIMVLGRKLVVMVFKKPVAATAFRPTIWVLIEIC
jgi:hypothetical protein